MRKLIVAIILIMSSHCVMSQQTTELGIQVAGATYWGDIENAGFSKSITPVFGILGRWNFNKRLAARGQLFTGNLKAEGFFSDANIGQSGIRVVPEEYQKDPLFAYNFSRSFQSVEALFEFNFRNYKLGSTKKEAFTPFVEVGLGGFFSRALRSGSYILNPFETTIGSGLYAPYLDANLNKTNNFDVLTVTIPVGAGIKFNLSKRLGGIVEVIVRKTFSDNIDNLDDPKRFIIDPTNPAVINGTYQYPDKVSKMQLNNNDWYATFAVSLCYQLWSSKGNCAIYDKIKK
ncbi:MAG: DUF6089 family protein [Bacteroidia bacterium]|nr:DUF6089 family protein [Bacteroidia bacterium]